MERKPKGNELEPKWEAIRNFIDRYFGWILIYFMKRWADKKTEKKEWLMNCGEWTFEENNRLKLIWQRGKLKELETKRNAKGTFVRREISVQGEKERKNLRMNKWMSSQELKEIPIEILKPWFCYLCRRLVLRLSKNIIQSVSSACKTDFRNLKNGIFSVSKMSVEVF